MQVIAGLHVSDFADEEEVVARSGADADRLNNDGTLYEPSLAFDVSKGGSGVVIPQDCLRIGLQEFGPGFIDQSRRATRDIEYALMGGMAPFSDGGRYDCETAREGSRQPSMDPSKGLYCMSRQSKRILACGSSSQASHSFRPLVPHSIGRAGWSVPRWSVPSSMLPGSGCTPSSPRLRPFEQALAPHLLRGRITC